MGNYFSESYSKEVLKHVLKPQNMGEIKKASGTATIGNPVCGDIIKFFIRIDKNENGQEYIKDIKFQTLGCGAAIATSSMLTTMVKGKLLSEAEKVTKQTLVEALGGLPAAKIHCSVLGDEALKKAIEDYKNKSKNLI